METIERGKLRNQHMNNCSYVVAETSARPYEFAIGVGQWLTTCIANVCRKKTLSIVRKLCKFCMCTIFAIFNLCNDWRICSIEYSVRFAHTARVCRWRSKPIRALVKGNVACVCWTRWRVYVHLCYLLDTELTNVCVDIRQECMNVCNDNIWAIAHMPRWVITS